MNKQTQEALTRAQQVIRANNSAQEHCVNLKMDKCEHKNICEHCTHPAPQPAQEPVAWVGSLNEFDMRRLLNEGYELSTALYTHPAPSWQGLSDDEIVWLCPPFYDEDNLIANEFGFARAIEQALKEKNER